MVWYRTSPSPFHDMRVNDVSERTSEQARNSLPELALAVALRGRWSVGIVKQESLADAKASARQQCVYEGP